MPVESSNKIEAFQNILQKGNDEIDYYRKRQIAVFREAIIVQGLIAWGMVNIKEPSFGIKSAAALTALVIGGIGVWIINNYRKRIHFSRNKREKILEKIFEIMEVNKFPVFYPTKDIDDDDYKNHKAKNTSLIYSIPLIIFGIFASLIIFFGGQWMPK